MILERLKSGTADLHLQTEAVMPFGDPAFDTQAYVRLLQRTHGFFKTWESLAVQTGHADIVSFLRDRLRTQAIVCDLDFLQARMVPEVMPSSYLPDLADPASLLGSMYVVEGSTLGGQLIARMLESKLSFSRGQGYSFFVGAGPATGTRWKAFSRYLTEWSIAHPDAEDSIVVAARRTFEAYRSWIGSHVEEKVMTP